jgi:hypothetical protein
MDHLAQAKQLGPTTTSHPDNYDAFFRLYGPQLSLRSVWRRRSETYKGKLHVLAEQAAVQWALDLCQARVPCSTLASTVIVILRQDTTTDQQEDASTATELANLLLRSAELADSDQDLDFCRVALDLIENYS